MAKKKPDHLAGKWAGWSRAQHAFDLTGVVCETCGAPAQVRHHRDGRSLNNAPENVAPLCRACHARLHRTKTHCIRGHPLDDENVYVASSGQRYCRVCRKLRDRERADEVNRRQRERRASPRARGPYVTDRSSW